MLRQNLNFLLFFVAGIFYMVLSSLAQAGEVSGRILMHDGKPLVDGVALFFDSKNGPAPDPSKEFRLAEHVYLLDNDGNFKGMLPAGSYYLLGAIRAEPGSGRDEHLIFLIKGGDDTPLLITVPAEGLVELGTVAQEETIPQP